MDNNQKATETNASAIAPKEVVTATLPTNEDAEARYKALEEEKENYKKAYLKLKEKKQLKDGDDDLPEDTEEKMRRIAEEALVNSKLAETAREQEALIQTVLKENKELKLAQLSKTTAPSATIGTHSEATPVKDGAITAEQEKYFREVLKWSDKDFARYRKNLVGRV